MHVGGAGDDEADATIIAGVKSIERARGRRGAQRVLALVHQRHARFGVARDHHPAPRILDEAGRFVSFALPREDATLDVADARGQAQDDRAAELLGEGESRARHGVGLLRVRRLEQRQVGKAWPEARILLVLRRGHAHIVRNRNHQPAFGAGHRHRHQRVGGDIEAEMLDSGAQAH